MRTGKIFQQGKNHMKITKYDPTQGQCFQGDIMIMPLPDGITISTIDEIKMRGNMLVLAEGEVTGHHHAIRYGLGAAAQFHDGALAHSLETVAAPAIGTAKMYRDPAALAALIHMGILTTDALCIGFLFVEENCQPLTHDEHSGIEIPTHLHGYYVGAKREQDASDTRLVAD
jgi:hypothetical protein